jgi:prevent-host-death family protein
MQKQIGLTDARGKFSEIVNEVMYREDTYIISKMGKPAVAVVPLSVLREWQEQREKEVGGIKHSQTNSTESAAT